MADYMATHPYGGAGGITSVFQHRESSAVLAAKANHMHTTPAQVGGHLSCQTTWRVEKPFDLRQMGRILAISERWNGAYYHQAIQSIHLPLLIMGGADDATFDAVTLGADAASVPLAGPAVILDGFTQYILWEEREAGEGDGHVMRGGGTKVSGQTLVLDALARFHRKWHGAMDDH